LAWRIQEREREREREREKLVDRRKRVAPRSLRASRLPKIPLNEVSYRIQRRSSAHATDVPEPCTFSAPLLDPALVEEAEGATRI
jgi:hypothetical protein